MRGWGWGGAVLCINMRELAQSTQQLRGEQPVARAKAKRSDGIDTVCVGWGSTLCAPANNTVRSHCSVSPPACYRAQRLHENQNIPFLASHLSIVSSQWRRQRGKHLTSRCRETQQFAISLSNDENIVCSRTKVFTAFSV